MKNSAVSRSPVAAFATPPHPPEAVAAARVDFDRIASDWARLKDEIRDAQAPVPIADARDINETSGAIAKGKTVAPNRHGDQARASLADLEARLPGLATATDQAGNRFAEEPFWRSLSDGLLELIEEESAP